MNKDRRIRESAVVWADQRRIKDFYNARDYLRSRGTLVDVDHIIPIKHHLVCGLHNEFNLQLLYSDRNHDKSNSFEPGNYPNCRPDFYVSNPRFDFHRGFDGLFNSM